MQYFVYRLVDRTVVTVARIEVPHLAERFARFDPVWRSRPDLTRLVYEGDSVWDAANAAEATSALAEMGYTGVLDLPLR